VTHLFHPLNGRDFEFVAYRPCTWTRPSGSTCLISPAPSAPRAAPAVGPARQLRPDPVRILDGMTEVPAFAGNGRLDVLAAKPLAQALYAPAFAGRSLPLNLARFNFLSPHARTFCGNWERAADDTVTMLRSEAGRDPYDKDLAGLVGELSTPSDEFRVRWGAHDVRLHRTGLKHIRHPVAGDLHLSYEVMELTADPGGLAQPA
jgi:MmyB-like transcription regulator ligand binding domain